MKPTAKRDEVGRRDGNKGDDLSEWHSRPRNDPFGLRTLVNETESIDKRREVDIVMGSDSFQVACLKAKVKLTRRQALKWLRGEGAAWKGTHGQAG